MRREQHTSDEPPFQKRKPAALSSAHDALSHRLLAWYQRVRRDLPWRALGDPYAIWVSEVMLQQTQVQTVIPYYERWLASFPTVLALAEASEAEVMSHWQGLGYYSRARNLQKGARAIVAAGGAMPTDVAGLRSLPGIGAYTAGAIASIALGHDEPAIDGNIERVLTRLFALGGDPKREPLRGALWELARQLLPKGNAGTFNQALMELGALCCTPKRPLCDGCPVRADCKGFASRDPTRFPESAPRAKLSLVHTVATAVVRNGRLLLVELSPAAPRWGGLWVLPFSESAGPTPPACKRAAEQALERYTGLGGQVGGALHSLTHHITRYRIELQMWQADVGSQRGSARGDALRVQWVPLAELDRFALPAPHRKLARWLQSHDPQGPARPKRP